MLGATLFYIPRAFMPYLRDLPFGKKPDGSDYTDTERGAHPLAFIGIGVIFSSFSCLLLGVLPSDVSAIKIANRLLGGIFIFSILSSGILANLFLGLYVESGYTDIPRLQRGCFQATVMLICLIHFVRVIMAAFLPPRSRLDQLWRVLAQFLFLNGVVWFVTAVLRVFPDWCNPSFYTFAIYLLANGAIIGWPNFRVRAQAFLSSRGGTHMAAGIAAAIGTTA